ncbi:unnamed protein product [Camellia sinensis]
MKSFAQRCFTLIDEYAPGFSSSIIGYDMLTPPDLEREIGLKVVEEGIMLNVAGGLMLEHPLTLPFVDTMVGTIDFVKGLPKSLTEKLIQEALYILLVVLMF